MIDGFVNGNYNMLVYIGHGGLIILLFWMRYKYSNKGPLCVLKVLFVGLNIVCGGVY